MLVQFLDGPGKACVYSITASPKALKDVKPLPSLLGGEPIAPISYTPAGKDIAYGLVSAFGVLLIVSTLRAGGVSTSVADTSAVGSTPAAAPAPAEPELELQSFSWGDAYSFLEAEGAVKNITGEKMENVEAVVNFYDAAGNFVKSADALIEYNPILPNQTSPFKVITTNNPAIEKARVEFKFLFGGTISYRERDGIPK